MARLFQGLRRDPDPRYDVVVVGAGVAGLVAATLLARDGARVLLVEQHYMTGGYCSTFRRKGCTFDAATHFYPLLGNPETITGGLLKSLSLDCGWIAMDPVDQFHLPDGARFQVPADFNAYLRRVKRMFPREAQALDDFFREVRKLYMHGMVQYFRWRESPRIADRLRETLGQALDRHFTDPRLKLLLCADCAHWGSPPSRISYVFDSMLRLSYFLGNYYPRGGSQRFADALAKRFEDFGGHILMSCRATRFRVEGGRATGFHGEVGVRNKRPVSVKAPVILSTADLRLTLDELLAPRWVPCELRRRVAEMRASFPCYLTHIALRGVPEERLEEAQGYYWDDWDPEKVGRDGLRFKLFSPTLYDPSLSKEGQQILIVQKVRDVDFASVKDWRAHGMEHQRWVDRQLRRVLPEIDQHMEAQLTATAETSRRYTLNLRGSMLGWEVSPDQLGAGRPGLKGPVEGLFFAGHWVQPGGGITPVMISAQRAARMARHYLEGL